MRGLNPIVTQKQMLNDGSEYLLAEAPFFTLQGEGPQTGWPAVFVRLAKCNLRCFFCDTSFEQGSSWTIDTLVEAVITLCSSNADCRLVVLTGGEPLLQNVVPLIQRLNHYGISVAIETAGTVYVEGLASLFCPHRPNDFLDNLIICSPKTAGIHPQLRPLIGAFKYIIREGEVDPNDGLPNKSTQRHKITLPRLVRDVQLFRPSTTTLGFMPPIYVQPMDEGSLPKNRRNEETAKASALRFGYRLSQQTHKALGLP